MKHPELLIPASSLEVLKTAVMFGADAVYCLASRELKSGMAFKIEDGSYAAVTPMVIAMLKHFNYINEEEYNKLLSMYPPVLKNHRGDIIGEIKAVF